MNKQNLSFYGFYGLRILQGRNPQGAPRIPTRHLFLTNLNHFYPVAGDEARQQVAAVRISLAE